MGQRTLQGRLQEGETWGGGKKLDKIATDFEVIHSINISLLESVKTPCKVQIKFLSFMKLGIFQRILVDYMDEEMYNLQVSQSDDICLPKNTLGRHFEA